MNSNHYEKTAALKPVRGISVVNPDEVERDYLLFCVDYAEKNNYNHIQITGPIHDPVKGNIDGMTYSVKYSRFNGEKNAEYVDKCLKVVNEACKKANAAGIKTYMWHHELALPSDFKKVFPETVNENGDIEVSHPIVKDYLENKIIDFFNAYPLMDGIVLTLHETKIPLLKLKNQKLGKIERVKFVTEIIYNTCKSLGKDLIVRPFASLEEDQTMMLKAYAEISHDMTIMDKWTKFDWSLTLPDNDFFKKITENPFVVETDIFGEYFGKGSLPIMLKEHIGHKFSYCNTFPHKGFVNRIDREHRNPFGSVNEVNLVIMHALVNGLDEEKEIDSFFKEKYGNAGDRVRAIMERTEELQKKIFYLKGYYFTQGSFFPDVNHSKNHFWFEIMKDDCNIASDEWFIPVGWQRGSINELLEEKNRSVAEASELLNMVLQLENDVKKEEYDKLLAKFINLDFVAKLWRELAYAIYNYTKYFEKEEDKYRVSLYENMKKIDAINSDGIKLLGENYYNYKKSNEFLSQNNKEDCGFTHSLNEIFLAEKKAYENSSDEVCEDIVICGSALESHCLQKEVNFSDTLIYDGEICRIAGNKAGLKWSSINAHGWFSYEIKVKKNAVNNLIFTFGSATDTIRAQITVNGKVYNVNERTVGKKDYVFEYKDSGAGKVRVRIDRVDENTPMLFKIKVKS